MKYFGIAILSLACGGTTAQYEVSCPLVLSPTQGTHGVAVAAQEFLADNCKIVIAEGGVPVVQGESCGFDGDTGFNVNYTSTVAEQAESLIRQVAHETGLAGSSRCE